MGRTGGHSGGHSSSHSSSRSFSGHSSSPSSSGGFSGHSSPGPSNSGGSSLRRRTGGGASFTTRDFIRICMDPSLHHPDPNPPVRVEFMGRTVHDGPYITYDEYGNKLHTSLRPFIGLIILFSVMAFCFLCKYISIDKTEKLDSSLVTTINTYDLIQDDTGWLTEDIGSRGIDEVAEGMDYFYDKTGVQPAFILTTGQDMVPGYEAGQNMEETLDACYEELFDDEGHMIFLVTLNKQMDDYDSAYLYIGKAAENTIRLAQENIIYDKLDYYFYSTSVDEYKLFSKTFIKSADKIMETGILYLVITLVCVLLDLVSVASLVKTNAENNKTARLYEENRHMEEVNKEYQKMINDESDEES